MEAYFNIYQSCTETERPPISYKIRAYFEKFITENVLKKKKIIIGGRWKIILAIFFSGGGPKVLYKGIGFAKGSRTVSAENVKIYEVFILLKPIEDTKNPLLKTIELIYEAIKNFITTTYKKVNSELMDELWKQVDLDYLLSLPYPAPLSEQKYVGDRIRPEGTVELFQLK
ncbi:MAG TPA: hypothetical protein VIJ92_16360 [Ginsengibacter sp.]